MTFYVALWHEIIAAMAGILSILRYSNDIKGNDINDMYN